MRRSTLILAGLLVTAVCLVYPPDFWPPMQRVDLRTIHTGGRMRVGADGASLEYGWPGVYFEANFAGSGVGLQFDDARNNFDVLIDGKPWREIDAPGRKIVRIEGLAPGNHTVRVERRTESPFDYDIFRGFVPINGGHLIPPPANRARQMEFIGDSHSVGYAVNSNRAACDQRIIFNGTDTSEAFTVLTAKHYDADYQINAFSGKGVVRNVHDDAPGKTLPTYYGRTLPCDPDAIWRGTPAWKPQIVVIDLGTNDFSDPVQLGEHWRTAAELDADYIAGLERFTAQIRQDYGPQTAIILTANDFAARDFEECVRQVVYAENQSGDHRVYYFCYNGLAGDACFHHPNAADHRAIASALIQLIDTIPDAWTPKSSRHFVQVRYGIPGKLRWLPCARHHCARNGKPKSMRRCSRPIN